jgi:hypothetical protein
MELRNIQHACSNILVIEGDTEISHLYLNVQITIKYIWNLHLKQLRYRGYEYKLDYTKQARLKFKQLNHKNKTLLLQGSSHTSTTLTKHTRVII